MSPTERLDEVTSPILAWARRVAKAEAAAFLPLGPDGPNRHEGATDEEVSSLLTNKLRASLRGSDAVHPAGSDATWRILPVRCPKGETLGGLALRMGKRAELAAQSETELRELACMLSQLLIAGTPQEESDSSMFFHLSLDLLVIGGFDGYFKLLNPPWEEVLGYTLEELYSRPWNDFVHPDDRQKTSNETGRLNKGFKVVTFDNRYICKDGSLRHLQWTSAPSTERQRVYAVARDITAQRAHREALEQSRAAAEAANQAKSAFLAMMSHELRTPLNSVIGFSSLLLRNAGSRLTDEEVTYAERIQANGENLLDLINSILDLSRIEAGRVEPDLADVDLVELGHECVAGLTTHARAGVNLKVEAPAGPIAYRTDSGRLRQILVNLLSNGLKFTEEGSVTLRLIEDAEKLSFEVVDTGPGIPQEAFEKVFEPFRQLEETEARQHGGSGLGLAISRSFADSLGLKIEVESEVGRGTTFRVLL